MSERSDLIMRLRDAFPLGFDAAQMALYEEKTAHFDPQHLRAAIDSLIAIHQTRRAPSIAKLIEACEGLSRRSDDFHRTDPNQRRMTEPEVEMCIQIILQLGKRGVFWNPDTERFQVGTVRSESQRHEDVRESGSLPEGHELRYRAPTRAEVEAAWEAHGHRPLTKDAGMIDVLPF